MAIKGNSLPARFNRWQVLVSNIKENQRSSPAILEKLAELEALLAEARALQDRQAQFRGQSQEITKQLIVIAGRGDRVRSRLGALLNGEIGFTTEELIRYGLNPRRLPPKTRRVVVVQAPATESTESTESAATTTQPTPGAPRA
jgi:hypothetical protein